ncbi:MAG: efflux RND transporter permease subunit [Saprospiraceae bacterium]
MWVDANIVALSGIAIAIGTMVDMGIVLTESMIKRMEECSRRRKSVHRNYEATRGFFAVLTAAATTIISFIPVCNGSRGGQIVRRSRTPNPFALVSSIVVAITILPSLAHVFFYSKD